MYEVYLDGNLLYYPGDKINSLVSTLLNTKLNDSGTFEITVPPTNPLYNAFELRKSELTVIKDGKEIWNGEVRSCKDNLKKEKMIYAVGELAYLNASSQPQKKYTNITPLQMLTYLLVEHNSRVEERKQFTVGIVTVGSSNYDWTTNYENTLDYIRSEICEKLDGYLRIRKENGIRYLDLVRLQDYGKTCQQPIKFGKNMLDYASGLDADAIVTAIRPLGAPLENSPIEGVETYVTIESINDGKDYIENIDAINSGIGYVWQTVHFNVLKDPNALKAAGQNWLQSKQFENMTISITAVDLSELNSDIQSFDLGDNVRTIAKPFGMDKWSYITEKKLDLLNPATRHNISIGEQIKKSYTQQITSEQNVLKNQIPQQGTLLELAKKNASEIIKHATEGNIYFINDEDGVPKELLTMDTPDINTAKKVWRWNINGLGYSSTGYKGKFGLALTMDGHFVADAITVDGLVVGKNVTMGENATISWDNVTEQPDIPSKTSDLENNSGFETATSIKNTVITKEYIETLKVKAGSVDAENITGTNIKGKTLTGSKVISDSDNTVYSIEIDDGVMRIYGSKNGAKILVGKIACVGITGDTSNTYDGLTIFGAHDAAKILLGFATDASTNSVTGYYCMNNSKAYGYDERHIWWGNERHLGVAYGDGMVFNYDQGIISSKYVGISESGEVYYPGYLLGVNGNVYIAVGLTAQGGINCDAVKVASGVTAASVFASGGMQCTTFVATGTKSRLTDTEDYGKRLLYCYETPTPMFGDIGEGQLDETGKCFVFLDDIFAETIDTDCSYQVFLQPYGKGECYVTERTSSYFIVEGTENLSFGWEVKAIQRDFDTMRLEEYEEPASDGVSETLSETETYLNSLLYNVENYDLEDVDYE